MIGSILLPCCNLSCLFKRNLIISSYKKHISYLKYINNLFKINEAFRSFLHPQVKIIKEKSYIKMIYNVKINQIYITLVYSRDTISKKMRNLNVKLIIEARFEFCYVIGLKDLPFVSLMPCRCNYLPVYFSIKWKYRLSTIFLL